MPSSLKRDKFSQNFRIINSLVRIFSLLPSRLLGNHPGGSMNSVFHDTKHKVNQFLGMACVGLHLLCFTANWANPTRAKLFRFIFVQIVGRNWVVHFFNSFYFCVRHGTSSFYLIESIVRVHNELHFPMRDGNFIRLCINLNDIFRSIHDLGICFTNKIW